MSLLEKALGGTKKIDNFRIIPPLDGGWSLAPMDNLLRGISHHKEPVSLELYARDGVVCYMVRAYHGESLGGILHSYFPQARVERRVDDGLEEPDDSDWLFVGEDEYALVQPLYLREESFLPLRIYADRDIEQSKKDPLAGVIGLLGSATHAGGEAPGDRLGLRLVLHPAKDNWNAKWRDRFQQRKDGEDKQDLSRSLSPSQREAPKISLMLLVGGTVLWALGNLWLWNEYSPLHLVPFNLGAALLAVAGRVFMKKVQKDSVRDFVDEELIDQKLKSPCFDVEVQVVRVYRNLADQGAAEEQAQNLVDCLRSHDDPVGNSLKSGKPLYFRGEDIYQQQRKHPFLGGTKFLDWLNPKQAAASILSSREVAAIWHPPLGTDEMASMERSAGGVLRPFLSDLARGGEDAGPIVGVAESGQEIRLPESALKKHSLILGKSGVGKSTMVKHIISYKLQRKAAGKDNSAVVVIDPHADLVRDVLKMVPPEIAHKVRLLDFGRRDRVPGINLVDPRLFPDRDRCVDTIITTVKHLWEHWGGRLEDLLKRSLSMIYEYNANPITQPEEMLTILDILQLLDEGKQVGQGRDARTEASDFQKHVLGRVEDPSLVEWFNSYLGWGRDTRAEAVGPVHSRVGAYAQDSRASVIMGQRDSTIMLSDVLKEGLVLLVSTAQGTIGIQPAALMGGTMISLVEAALRDQESLDPSLRAKCLLVADEFQTITGANWEGMLAEIRKYGASLMLATQSLERLDTPERKLKAGILGNVGVMVGYNMSAADAHILAAEMDDERVLPRTFVNLDPHHCCVRITSDRTCYPAFSMKTLPPPDMLLDEAAVARSEDAVLKASFDYTVDWADARKRMQAEKRRRLQLDKMGGLVLDPDGPGFSNLEPEVAAGGNGNGSGSGAGGPAAAAVAAALSGGNGSGSSGNGNGQGSVPVGVGGGGSDGSGNGRTGGGPQGLMARFGAPAGGAGNGNGNGSGPGLGNGAGSAAPAVNGGAGDVPPEEDVYLKALAEARQAREARLTKGPLRGLREGDLAGSQASRETLEELAGLQSSDPALRFVLNKRLGDQANAERQRVRQEESERIRQEVEAGVAAELEEVAAEKERLAAERDELERRKQAVAVDVVKTEAAAAIRDELGVELESTGQSRDSSRVQPAARQRPVGPRR